MSAFTPPPSCRGSDEPEAPDALDGPNNASGCLDAKDSIPALSSFNERQSPAPGYIAVFAQMPNTSSQENDADTKMTDAPMHHEPYMKKENLTPLGSSRSNSCHAVSVKSEEFEIKTEVKSEAKSEFESEAVGSPNSRLIAPAQMSKHEGSTIEPKQTRNISAPKTAREYHQRKHHDPKNGIRKAKKIIRSLAPERLLHSMAHQDLVSAYNAGPSDGAAPMMTVSTKRDFMKEIIDKCPKVDLQKFKTELSILDEAARSLGFRRVKMTNGMWLVTGMKTPLYHYQLLGATFMVERECSVEGPYGGILADAMGLGKTVQSIATIVGNPPTPELKKKHHRTTLIIAPRSLLHQWKAELEKHGKFKKVWIYNNADKDNNNPRKLMYEEVVLATYDAIRQNFPSLDRDTMQALYQKAVEAKGAFTDVLQDWVEKNKKNAGCLHNMRWYRVILDEAQLIKNPFAKTTLAVQALRSHYRWALSGTPAQNGPEDYYSLFCFIKDPEISKLTFSEYQSRFCGPEQFTELAVAVSKVTIRRTLQDEVLGKKLVDLPAPHTQSVIAIASDAERILYDAIERRLFELRKEKLDNEDERKALSTRLAQITCLRQLTTNPDLIEDEILAMFASEHLETLQDELDNLEVTEKSRDLLKIMKDRINGWLTKAREKEHDKTKKTQRRSAQKKKHCLGCKHKEIEDLQIMPKCKHVYCLDCIDGIEEVVVEDDEAVKYCPKCKSPFYPHKVKPCQTPTPSKKRSKGVPSSKRGRDALDFRPSPVCATEWLKRLDNKKNRLQIVPTSKVAEIMDTILRWKKEYPRDKVTIFTQWNHFAVMLGVLLQQEKIEFVYIIGSMTSQQRSRAVQEFSENKQVHVMIMGLKAGGLGLNLTVANRGILVDSWWNKAVEDQAQGRFHRIGQTKPTWFMTIIVEDTIDGDVVELQERKEISIKSVTNVLSEKQRARLERKGLMDTEEDDASGDDEEEEEYEGFNDDVQEGSDDEDDDSEDATSENETSDDEEFDSDLDSDEIDES